MSRIIKAASIILLIGILIQVLYDPYSSAKHSLEVSNVLKEFPQARAKWETLGITNYTFEIQGNTPDICQPSAIIEVKNNEVVKVETKDFASANSPAQILSPYQWADPDWGDEVFLCNYYHFNMTRIFDLLEEFTRSDPSTILQVNFDPNYGFITDFKYGLYLGHGLLNPHISNCCSNFSIKNFQPANH